MSIYISKNAITNIPLTDEGLANNTVGGILVNEPLIHSDFLKKLASDDTIKLGPKSKPGKHIMILKLALIAIDVISDDFKINDELIANEIFDTKLQNAIIAFQKTNPSLRSDGIVDSATLLEMDAKLSKDHIFDYEQKKYLGTLDPQSRFNVEAKLSNSQDELELIIEGGDKIKIKVDPKFSFSKINSSLDGNATFGVLDRKFLTEIQKNPLVAAKNLKRSIQGLPPLKVFGLANTDYNLDFVTAKIPISEAQNEANKTPSKPIEDKDAKLYKIKEGDTISKLVLENYYGTGGLPIKDPYDDSVIFTLPNRTPFPAAKRNEDARFQFYINLLYYYNSEVDGSDIKEWGLEKDNGYERYKIDHLDAVNIFDNIYNENDPYTALPNYHRFLKQMEIKNPASKIIFDSAGNTTSFTAITGKNIRIPSRQFADSLYYFLNFRHDKMFASKEDEESNTIVDYITNEALDDVINLFSDAFETIEDVAIEVKDDAILLYHETLEFFKEVYNFVIRSLTKYWPRGMGGKLGFEASVTWGVPVKTSLKKDKSFYRKMSKQEEIIFIYTTESTIGASVEHVEGFSYGIAKYSGHGPSKKIFGAAVGIELGAGVELIQTTEYEFPIRQNETALLTMIVNCFAGELIQSASEIFTSLNSLNVNPKHYITKTEVRFNVNLNATLEASVGAKIKKGIQNPRANQDEITIQNRTKSYASVDNIFSKIPSIGIDAAADFNGGVGYSYEVKFDSAPFTSNYLGRVFKEMEIDTKYYIDGKLDLNFTNNLLTKLIPGSDKLESGVNTIFDKIAFDQTGVTIGTNYTFKRNCPVDSLISEDFDFNEIDATALENENNKVFKYLTPNNNNHIEKGSSFYFSIYKGETSGPDTEVKLLLNMLSVYSMFTLPNSVLYDFEAVSKLFTGIKFKKKVGLFSFDGKKKNDYSICKQLVDSFKSKSSAAIDKEIDLIVEYATKILRHTETELSLSLEMEIDFSLIWNIFEFHLRKLYLKYVLYEKNSSLSKNVDFLIAKQTKKITTFLAKNGIEEGKEYYEYLYSDDGILNTTNDGLLKYIKDRIKDAPKPAKENYLNVAGKFLKGIYYNNVYMNNEIPDEPHIYDYGIVAIINAFSYLSELGGLEGKLESNLKFGLETDIKGGLFGAVVGGSVGAFAELNYQPTLYENGKLTDLPYNDPLNAVFKKIEAILGKQSNNKKAGAKTVFQVIPK